MKPNKTILDTDFYQLASDGSAELSFIVPKGTEFMKGINKTFKVGGKRSDYIAIFCNSIDKTWSVLSRGEFSVFISSGNRLSGRMMRDSSGKFVLETTWGGTQPLDRDIELKFRIKSFKFPDV